MGYLAVSTPRPRRRFPTQGSRRMAVADFLYERVQQRHDLFHVHRIEVRRRLDDPNHD